MHVSIVDVPVTCEQAEAALESYAREQSQKEDEQHSPLAGEAAADQRLGSSIASWDIEIPLQRAARVYVEEAHCGMVEIALGIIERRLGALTERLREDLGQALAARTPEGAGEPGAGARRGRQPR